MAELDMKQLDKLAKDILGVAEQQTTTINCRQVFQHAAIVGIAGLRNFGSDDDIIKFIDNIMKSGCMPIVELNIETVQ